MNTSKLTQIVTRKTSVALRLPEKLVDQVIAFQWKTANQAIHNSASIELSGLGRFDARQNKIINKLRLFEKYKESYQKKLLILQEGSIEYNSYLKKLATVEEDIEFLKNKLNEGQR